VREAEFGELTNQQKDMIERILNNGKNLLLLLNEVLDFAKIDAKKLELKPEVFDVSKVVNSAVAEMRSLAEIKKLSLLVEIDLQNKSLSDGIGLIKQMSAEKAKEWLRENQIKAQEAKDRSESIKGSTIRETNRSKSMDSDFLKTKGFVRPDTSSSVETWVLNGTLKERYEAVGKAIDELNVKLKSYNTEEKKNTNEYKNRQTKVQRNV
jgi:hypothetical protein